MSAQHSHPAGSLFFESLERAGSGIVMTVSCPDSVTGRLDLFSISNLTGCVWRVEGTLQPTGEVHRGTLVGQATNRLMFFRLADAGVDSDSDGLSDFREKWVHGTNPSNSDSDLDGMGDGWEVRYSMNPHTNDAAGDIDGDGLSNLEEAGLGSNPRSDDTDGDGLKDGWEAANGLDLLVDDTVADPDGDGWTNLQELRRGGNPQVAWRADTGGTLKLQVTTPLRGF